MKFYNWLSEGGAILAAAFGLLRGTECKAGFSPENLLDAALLGFNKALCILCVSVKARLERERELQY